jgi:TonB family protein
LHPVNGRICVSEKILHDLLVQRVAPKLPDTPNANGEVALHLVVAKNGRPARISVISGDPALTHSAVRAVKQWLFKPYIYNGEYVEMESTFTSISLTETSSLINRHLAQNPHSAQ